MFLFDLLFGNKKAGAAEKKAETPSASAAPQASAPGTTIGHDPALIDGLKKEQIGRAHV